MRLVALTLYSIIIGASATIVGSICVILTHMPVRVQAQQQSLTVAPSTSPMVAVGIPVALKIPVASIDTKIDLLGITPAGDMEAPKAPPDTGWYKLGTRPGDIGSAVIAGHYGNFKGGTSSVFDNLGILKKGDKVSVVDDTGSTITFTVQRTRVLGRDDDTRSVFTSSDNKSHLNLITCHGTWQPQDKTYSDRLVVFTDLDQNKS